jgi:TrkA-C domain
MPGAPAIVLRSHLDTALESITSAHMSWVSVLANDRRVVGVLSISDLVASYRRELWPRRSAAARSVRPAGRSSSASDLACRTLRAAQLPAGSLVTSIARNGEELAPSGDVVLELGDRLSLLG